jgi:hypothetical protein
MIGLFESAPNFINGVLDSFFWRGIFGISTRQVHRKKFFRPANGGDGSEYISRENEKSGSWAGVPCASGISESFSIKWFGTA